ncbi:MAG: hypothetical protein ACJZ13_03950 [Methylophilaceae bacterium]
MFEVSLLLFIVLVQNLAVFLDNYGVFYLTSRNNSEKVAKAYTKKYQIDFLCRGFLFFTPPLLGLMLTNNNLNFLLSCLLISAITSLILSVLQSGYFLKNMNLKFYLPITIKNILMILIGIVIYGIYLYVPFYLNILSYFFREQSLWIVQLSPILTAGSSIFVVYYLDPKIANFIDAKAYKKDPSILFELIVIRFFGRTLNVVISFFLITTFG